MASFWTFNLLKILRDFPTLDVGCSGTKYTKVLALNEKRYIECISGCVQDINLDHYITHKLPFSKINEAFELLNQGGCIRCVMDYEK